MKNQKNYRYLVFLVLSVLIVVGILKIKDYYSRYQTLIIVRPYTQEYIIGQGNIRGSVNTQKYLEIDKRLEIGAGEDGMAVFKDPHAAFDVLIEKYSEGIKAVQKQYKLNELTRSDYKLYGVYGWQVYGEHSEEALKQARFISGFFDIYENSFELE